MKAAERLFSQRGFSSVSIRELAAEADVTPAMIHYYFGSKSGIYKALLDSVIERLLSRIGQALEEGLGSEDRLTLLVDVFASASIKDPWLPSLILREVILNEGNFREYFIENYASKVATLIPHRITQEIEADRFRSDLNPNLAFVSLLGMTAFPFLARPVMEKIFSFPYDESFEHEFIQHTSRLFLHGVTKRSDHHDET